MKINSGNLYNRQIPNYTIKQNNQDESFTEELNNKCKESVQPQEKKRPLGRWAMIRTGLNCAKIVSINYAEDSTSNDPIMCTTSGDRVHINDVDPSNATELEMQMYCAHLDATGRGDGSKFGTYNNLKTVRMTALNNCVSSSDMELVLDSNSFRTIRRNWTELTKDVLDIIKHNDRRLYKNLEHMLNIIERNSDK